MIEPHSLEVANTHFMRLVRQGKHRGASGGEKAAYKLARAMLECAASFDETALDGAIAWCAFCNKNPMTAQDILRDRHI